jgi:hypothetical protein
MKRIWWKMTACIPLPGFCGEWPNRADCTTAVPLNHQSYVLRRQNYATSCLADTSQKAMESFDFMHVVIVAEMTPVMVHSGKFVPRPGRANVGEWFYMTNIGNCRRAEVVVCADGDGEKVVSYLMNGTVEFARGFLRDMQG